MKLSAPIHVLKSQAKTLKKEKSITMTEALNQIAQREGFNSWSLLQSKSEDIFPKKYDEVLSFLNPGDLVVIASRPGYGKTSFTVGLFVQAVQRKLAPNYLFTLAEIQKDIAGRIATYDETIGNFKESLGYPGNEHLGYIGIDYSNDICADYIIERTKDTIEKNSVIVVDYLQLLDEKRSNPPIQEQMEKLKEFAKEKGCIILFISQVAREIEYKNDKLPTMGNLRLPNPLDTRVFNKGIFLFRKSKEDDLVDVRVESGRVHRFQIKWERESAMFFDERR